MKPKRLQRIEKIENKLQNSKSKVVDLYSDIEKEENIQNVLAEQIHTLAIYEYQDRELRMDIVEKAIQYNYPEESLEDIKPYIEENVKWNNNVPDDIAEKYRQLDLYNLEYEKRIPLIRKLLNALSEILGIGGNEL